MRNTCIFGLRNLDRCAPSLKWQPWNKCLKSEAVVKGGNNKVGVAFKGFTIILRLQVGRSSLSSLV